jgi:AcrR family transcriptional regulator
MTTTEQYRTANGRVLGYRGVERRDTLLKNTEEHVGSVSWHKASIMEIARMSGCSPATFYQYWSTLEDAVAEILRQKMVSRKRIGKHWRRIREDLVEFGGWEF